MRIGIDATALPRQPVGAGNYIIHLIRALAREECEHELVVFAHPHGYDLVGVAARPGLRWVIAQEKSPALRLAWEQAGLPRQVGREGIDLFHSLHYTRPLALPCKSVVTFHDMTFFLFPELHTRAKRLFFPAAIRLSARLADALIAVSEATRQDAIRLLNIPAEKITAVPLGIDPAFRPIPDKDRLRAIRQRYNLPERYILYVGLIEPRKNLPLLVRAYRRLVDETDAPPLVLAGRMGWRVGEVRQQIEALGLQDRIVFTGYVPADDLPMVYNLAGLFVYPSTYEGFGLPPLEAMACGTPVITTSVSSMPENVGEGGILVPPGDESALFHAMRSVLQDPAMRESLSQKGQRQAAQFTWTRTAQQTLAIYRRILLRQ